MFTTKSQLRARWAAFGAATAVSLGAGGLGIVSATLDTTANPVYTAIEPCRLADTRAGTQNVGDRTSALGVGDTWTLNGWSDHGNCALPGGTAALELNVTAVGATSPTYLTLYPAGTPRPTASHLNPAPGQPPTPNAVTVAVDDNGDFVVYNAFGAVDVIVDVVGYYRDHDHDARYYTEAEIDAALAEAAAQIDLAQAEAQAAQQAADAAEADAQAAQQAAAAADAKAEEALAAQAEQAAALAALKAEFDAAMEGVVRTDSGKAAYAWVCNPDTPINVTLSLNTCDLQHNYNPAGPIPTITHVAAGEYIVGFPGLELDGGGFQVTARGDNNIPAYCLITGSTATQVGVRCHNSVGVATNTRFYLVAVD